MQLEFKVGPQGNTRDCNLRSPQRACHSRYISKGSAQNRAGTSAPVCTAPSAVNIPGAVHAQRRSIGIRTYLETVTQGQGKQSRERSANTGPWQPQAVRFESHHEESALKVLSEPSNVFRVGFVQPQPITPGRYARDSHWAGELNSTPAKIPFPLSICYPQSGEAMNKAGCPMAAAGSRGKAELHLVTKAWACSAEGPRTSRVGLRVTEQEHLTESQGSGG